MGIPSFLHYSCLAVIAALMSTCLLAQDAEKKAPVPDDAAQTKSTKLLKEVYGEELAAAKTASQKKALAKKLLEAATGNQDDLASKYVLLKVGKNVAVQALDAETAFEAVDRMADSFAVDPLAMKIDILDGLIPKARSASEHALLAGLALGLMDQALAAEKFQVAEQVGNAALEEARSAQSMQLLRQIQPRVADVRQKAAAFDEQRTALATLGKTPGDPQANLVVGRYRCLVKGDWVRGIPMLALGKDDDLKAAAMVEMKGAASRDEQVKLGDAWWDLAEKQEGAAKTPMQQRAGFWYQKALPELSGLMKDKIENRLAKMAVAPAIEAAGSASSGGPPLAVAPFKETTAKQHQARWARYLHAPVVQTNSIGMKLVLIPPGEFQMGSPKELIDEEQRLHGAAGWYTVHLPGEVPQHRVRITKPYWLGVTDVTQEEYQRVIGSNPSKVPGPKRPVEQVSWDDAVEFCRRLSELPREKAAKRRYGLPTEAQWEHACRAGTTTRWYSGDDEAGSGDVAWWPTNAGGQTHPVGQKLANAWGLYDMHGNVGEWCQDWYDQEYYATSPMDDPGGPPGGSHRVNRGGFFSLPARCGRSAYRLHYNPGDRGPDLGFRVSLAQPDR